MPINIVIAETGDLKTARATVVDKIHAVKGVTRTRRHWLAQRYNVKTETLNRGLSCPY